MRGCKRTVGTALGVTVGRDVGAVVGTEEGTLHVHGFLRILGSRLNLALVLAFHLFHFGLGVGELLHFLVGDIGSVTQRWIGLTLGRLLRRRLALLSRALLTLLLRGVLLGESGTGHAGGEKKSGQ